MTDILNSLLDDHAEMNRRFDVFEEESLNACRSDRLDVPALKWVLDYLLNYYEPFHHPKEGCILHQLYRVEPQVGQHFHFSDFDVEHRELFERTRDLASSVYLLIEDGPAPPPWIAKWAMSVFDAQRLHARLEEQQLFPVVMDAFGARQWTEIEDELFAARVRA